MFQLLFIFLPSLQFVALMCSLRYSTSLFYRTLHEKLLSIDQLITTYSISLDASSLIPLSDSFHSLPRTLHRHRLYNIHLQQDSGYISSIRNEQCIDNSIFYNRRDQRNAGGGSYRSPTLTQSPGYGTERWVIEWNERVNANTSEKYLQELASKTNRCGRST